MLNTKKPLAESISKKLRKQNKSNELFEIMLNNLTLEEMISLKLELVNKAVGMNLYGIPLMKSMTYIVKDAVLKYALSICNSKANAAQFLGIERKDLRILYNKHIELEKQTNEETNEIDDNNS